MNDPRRELAELSQAFHAELRRRRTLGWRRTDRDPSPTAPATGTADGAAPQYNGAAQAADAAPQTPAATLPAPEPVRTEAPAPSARRTPGPGANLAERVQAVRGQAQAASNLDELREAVSRCRACSLCETRTQTVFSDGQGSAGVMFVGEAPGYNEDAQGVPFVGQAGQLLTDIIEKGMRLERQATTICNVLKCRPPENRDPTTEEKALCTPWLDRQIELTAPRVIIPLGRHASGHLLRSEASMGQMRGRVHEREGRPVVPTYHPAYLLRSPEMKKVCWQDIQLAMGLLDSSDG